MALELRTDARSGDCMPCNLSHFIAKKSSPNSFIELLILWKFFRVKQLFCTIHYWSECAMYDMPGANWHRLTDILLDMRDGLGGRNFDMMLCISVDVMLCWHSSLSALSGWLQPRCETVLQSGHPHVYTRGNLALVWCSGWLAFSEYVMKAGQA